MSRPNEKYRIFYSDDDDDEYYDDDSEISYSSGEEDTNPDPNQSPKHISRAKSMARAKSIARAKSRRVQRRDTAANKQLEEPKLPSISANTTTKPLALDQHRNSVTSTPDSLTNSRNGLIEVDQVSNGTRSSVDDISKSIDELAKSMSNIDAEFNDYLDDDGQDTLDGYSGGGTDSDDDYFTSGLNIGTSGLGPSSRGLPSAHTEGLNLNTGLIVPKVRESTKETRESWFSDSSSDDDSDIDYNKLALKKEPDVTVPPVSKAKIVDGDDFPNWSKSHDTK
ncbi:unnamed protein product [Ambrosiozyma monospora]|uniref:Unnamed protein product n=1 Tax=Ambrosiozyma monospora TaxID=43982 RepID=A0A9W6Z1N9_AMBMO|nr:unnamed protein product [Ambrosiozyma monospora]